MKPRNRAWQPAGRAHPPKAVLAEDFSLLVRLPRRFRAVRGTRARVLQ